MALTTLVAAKAAALSGSVIGCASTVIAETIIESGGYPASCGLTFPGEPRSSLPLHLRQPLLVVPQPYLRAVGFIAIPCAAAGGSGRWTSWVKALSGADY
jgi:hypothetical protein